MRRPNPGGAMITTMQAASRKVNLRVGGHRSDIRLDIRESTPDWSSFTGPTPKARVQPVHHTARVTSRESPLRSAERSDESFTGLERHQVRQRLSQKSGPGRAGSPDSKTTHARSCGASVIEISDIGRR
jgi:hypothetical protein